MGELGWSSGLDACLPSLPWGFVCSSGMASFLLPLPALGKLPNHRMMSIQVYLHVLQSSHEKNLLHSIRDFQALFFKH